MAEYIERETLFEEIRKEFRPYWQIPCDYEDRVTQKMVTKMRGLIDKLPPADVVEVVHGEWKFNKDGSGTCNQCGITQKNVWNYDGWQNYCGHCGADMRGIEKRSTDV